MTSEARELARKAAEVSVAAELARHQDVIAGINGIYQRLDKQNGRIAAIELWKAETIGRTKGITEGAGGVGRLILGVLGAGSLAGGIIVSAFAIASHFQ